MSATPNEMGPIAVAATARSVGRFLAGNSADATANSGSRDLEALGWGLFSAFSLVLGAGIGIVRLPSKVVRASLMAFGGGALIEALSIELFAHIIATARGGGHGDHGGKEDKSIVFLALASAVGGGLLFAGLDRALSSHGAFLRKAATVHAYVGRLRYALLRRLIGRLRRVPMFEVLTDQELLRLARSMVKQRYPAGGVIFRELGRDSSIFFLLSGKVSLTIAHAASVNDEGSTVPVATVEPGSHELVEDHFRLGPNDIFGEIALFTGQTLQATAVAATPVTVLRISKRMLHHLLASNRRLQDFIAMTAIDRLRETDIFSRCTPSTVARLVTFMRQAEFEAGDVLYHDVDALCPIYFVVLGSVEVIRSDRQPLTGSVEAIEDEPPSDIAGITLSVDAGKTCERGDASNTSVIRRVVGANGLLGTEHLVHGTAVHSTASALERTTVLIVQRSDIDKLCERDERFKHSIVRDSLCSTRASRGGTVGQLLSAPPEGMVGPTKLGALEDLGWVRESVDEPQELEDHQAPPPASTSPAPSKVGDIDDVAEDGGFSVGDEDLPELLENADAAAAESGHKGGSSGHHGLQAALMIWLGILIDAVPESVVMGILVNTATQGTVLAFVVGVFLANFPESMSSAGTMKLHGMKTHVIMIMWSSIMVLTGVGAFIGAVVFPPGSTEDPTTQKVIACIEGSCGGAMLCMIANTVLPEAFEQGGNVTGLSTLMGFLVAIAVSVAA